MTMPPTVRKDLLLSSLLLVVFSFNFAFHNGWKDTQWPGDEVAYINAAYNTWRFGTHPDTLTWSPGYEVLMSPFVGAFGMERGYKIWRFILFGGTSLMIYLVFRQMYGSEWMGFILALYYEMLLIPYESPSLQSLVCLLYLICLRLLVDKPKWLGVVFAILLNALFVSGSVPFVLVTFGILCVAFCPRQVFSWRFAIQSAAGVLLFGLFLWHYSYDIRSYPEEAASRGRIGLYHQLSLFIMSSGRSTPYLKPGENDPSNEPNEYNRHRKAIERYYLDKWGQGELQLRARNHDTRWPAFLLDWPWMLKEDPPLMKAYRREVVRTLLGSIDYTFRIILPFGDYNATRRSASRKMGNYALLLAIVLMFPTAARLARPKQFYPARRWPSGLQLLLMVCCLATLMPLTLVNPLSIYFPPLIPPFFMLTALLVASAGIGLEHLTTSVLRRRHGGKASFS